MSLQLSIIIFVSLELLALEKTVYPTLGQTGRFLMKLSLKKIWTHLGCWRKEMSWFLKPERIPSWYGIFKHMNEKIFLSNSRLRKLIKALSIFSLNKVLSAFNKMDDITITHLDWVTSTTLSKIMLSHSMFTSQMKYGLMNTWSVKPITLEQFVGSKEDMMMALWSGLMNTKTVLASIKFINMQTTLLRTKTWINVKSQSPLCGKCVHPNFY